MNPEQMEEIRRSVKRIESCLLGDEEIGQFGLVSRVNNHAGRIKRIERSIISVVSGAGVVAVIYKIAVDFWPHK